VGSIDPKFPLNSYIGKFLKAQGAKVLCVYGYGISPSSARAAKQIAEGFQRVGGKVGVLDTSVVFGSVNMTTTALIAKQNHCDTFIPGLDNNSNFALVTALHQAGVNPKLVLLPTGYEPDVINSPGWQSLQGTDFESEYRPFQMPDAATQRMQSALVKYAGFKSGQFPSFGQYESWLGADLLIQGLEHAGANPTLASTIKALRNIKAYNGGGILPISLNYSTVFGHDPKSTCVYVLAARQHGFVPLSKPLWCGSDIPGTSTAS
jgi:branched-chain amino acid transport system substrate-binding protein